MLEVKWFVVAKTLLNYATPESVDDLVLCCRPVMTMERLLYFQHSLVSLHSVDR